MPLNFERAINCISDFLSRSCLITSRILSAVLRRIKPGKDTELRAGALSIEFVEVSRTALWGLDKGPVIAVGGERPAGHPEKPTKCRRPLCYVDPANEVCPSRAPDVRRMKLWAEFYPGLNVRSSFAESGTAAIRPHEVSCRASSEAINRTGERVSTGTMWPRLQTGQSV